MRWRNGVLTRDGHVECLASPVCDHQGRWRSLGDEPREPLRSLDGVGHQGTELPTRLALRKLATVVSLYAVDKLHRLFHISLPLHLDHEDTPIRVTSCALPDPRVGVPRGVASPCCAVVAPTNYCYSAYLSEKQWGDRRGSIPRPSHCHNPNSYVRSRL